MPAPDSQPDNFVRRLLLALTPIAVFSLTGALCGFGKLAARLTNDDQAYYIIVARNLFTKGPTYDGLYFTNGFHPLYASILGAVYKVLAVSWSNLSVVAVTTCVCCGSGFLYLVQRARQPAFTVAMAASLLLSALGVFPVLYRGMESSVALLAIAVYFHALRRPQVRLSVLALATTILWATRLELIALPPILLLLAKMRGVSPWRRSQSEIARAWGFALLGFGLYLLLNQAYCGIALPVSALIKQQYPRFLPYFAGLGGACLLMSVAGLRLPSWQKWMRLAPITQSLLAFSAFFYLSHAFGQVLLETQTWYYFLLPAIGAYALIEWGDHLTPSLRRNCLFMAMLAWSLSLVWEMGVAIPKRAIAREAMSRVISQAKSIAQPGERFMGPGSTALLVGPEFEPFSHDGLVGGVGQYRARLSGNILSFAYQSNVRFVIIPSHDLAQPRPRKQFRFELVSHGLVPGGGSFWALFDSRAKAEAKNGSSVLSVYRLSVHLKEHANSTDFTGQ